MIDNPFAGAGFHAAGGVAHGSFYLPLKRVRAWAWESAWLVQGLAAWLIMPWFVCWLTGAHPIAGLSCPAWAAVTFAGVESGAPPNFQAQRWSLASEPKPHAVNGKAVEKLNVKTKKTV